MDDVLSGLPVEPNTEVGLDVCLYCPIPPIDPNEPGEIDVPKIEEGAVLPSLTAPIDPNVPVPDPNNDDEGGTDAGSLSASLSLAIAVPYPPNRSTDPVPRIEGGEVSLIDSDNEGGGVPISISLQLSLCAPINGPRSDPNNEASFHGSPYNPPFPPFPPPPGLEKKESFFLYLPPPPSSLSGALGLNLAGDE